jgi:hypothetical protein
MTSDRRPGPVTTDPGGGRCRRGTARETLRGTQYFCGIRTRQQAMDTTTVATRNRKPGV